MDYKPEMNKNFGAEIVKPIFLMKISSPTNLMMLILYLYLSNTISL
jgi:hypothetical protein